MVAVNTDEAVAEAAAGGRVAAAASSLQTKSPGLWSTIL